MNYLLTRKFLGNGERNHLVDSVQKYIFTLNTGYREQLRDKHVEYFNAMGRFVDEHTIECTDYKGRKVL